MNVVKFAQNIVDYGDNPEYFVSGIASVARISNGVIRETYYTEVLDSEGRTERRVALRVLWDAEQWFATRRAMAVSDLRHVPAPPRQEGDALVH